jgi:hypothetical protein
VTQAKNENPDPTPNPDKWRADSRKTLGEMSDRTLARYEPATRMLREANIDFKPFFEAATRPNGSFNVSRLYCLLMPGIRLTHSCAMTQSAVLPGVKINTHGRRNAKPAA